MANNTVAVMVTACDRNGKVWSQIYIHRSHSTEAFKDRRIAFETLREQFEDCQVYFDWSMSPNKPLTKPLGV